MKEAPRQPLIRRSDEPQLELGDTVAIKDGAVRVVLARFIPSGERSNEIHYIVELRPDGATGLSRVPDCKPPIWRSPECGPELR